MLPVLVLMSMLLALTDLLSTTTQVHRVVTAHLESIVALAAEHELLAGSPSCKPSTTRALSIPVSNDTAVNSTGEVLRNATNDDAVCVGLPTTVDLSVGEDRELQVWFLCYKLVRSDALRLNVSNQTMGKAEVLIVVVNVRVLVTTW